MAKRCVPVVLALCLLLTGCGWLNGSYLSVTPHQQRQNPQTEVVSAANYSELVKAMETIIAAGTEMAAINVADYPSSALERSVEMAVKHVLSYDAVAAYAVKEIQCEMGSSAGEPAVAVNVEYLHGRPEIQQIRHVQDSREARKIITEALEGFASGIVLLVEKYESRDYTQFVEDYAQKNPQTVIETPQVTETVYGNGGSRVVELVFAYQNSRDSLRRMQNQVRPVFDSAMLYVSGDDAPRQKYAQLYAFLMERFDYKIETSITPAYSLLRHGVGDSRAFATVYAAMCRGAGLECMVVTGTHAGAPLTWNMIQLEGRFYHVDLLACSKNGKFQTHTDAEMGEYVWDYSMYPANASFKEEEWTEETGETEPSEGAKTGKEK